MSEIFNWIKKTEFRGRSVQSDTVSQAAETIPFQYLDESAEAQMDPAAIILNSGAASGSARAQSSSNAKALRHDAIDKSTDIMPESTIPADPIGGSGEGYNPSKFDLSAIDQRINSILDPLTLVGEQFRLLRSRLDIIQKRQGVKTVMITSAVPKEGKTLTTRSLAGILAQEPGKKVLLIDADLRKAKPEQGNGRLSKENCMPGLAQVLGAEASFRSVLVGSTNDKLFFLPSGPVPPNPSELLSSPILAQTLKMASELFDWVIVDTPPVIAISDAISIAHLCDAVILVIQAHATSSKLATDTIQRLGRERICGIVMNRVRNIHSSRYYYQYYSGALKPGK